MPERDWWQDHPWRLIQTNLREIDMADIDAERMVSDLRDFRATVLMINAAGIIASYPTKLPFHFQSPYLTGDSLQEIIQACHDADIRVIARTDFSKVRRPIFEEHPDWAYRTSEGQIVDYNGDVHVCINGDYQQHYALEILRELLTTHAFDGIFFNMGGFITRDYSGNSYGPCHCDACQASFREFAGFSVPRTLSPDDPTTSSYRVWQGIRRREHQQKISDFLTELRPDLCIANHLHPRRGFIRQESNTAIERPLPHWQYSASDNTRWARGSYPEMVSSNTTVDFIDFPYRHVTVSPHQQKLRLAQNLANGGAIDWYLIGRIDNHEDRSGFAPVREMFQFHAANEESYRNLRSLARIALIKGGDNAAEYRGWFRVLVENHFLFDVLTVEAAGELSLEGYDAIVLPDVRAIGDDLAGKIDQFVRDGGTLVATGQSGFAGEDFEPRDHPAVESLGLERVARIREETTSSYLRLTGDDLPRSAETNLVYVHGPYVYADYVEDADCYGRLIPPHNFGPPERCYYETVTDHPGYVVSRFGEGRCVYVPWQPGALLHRQGHTNTIDFAADMLQAVAGLAPLEGNLPAQVEATLHQGDGFRLLQLVNTSGCFGNTFYAPTSMTDLEVTIPCEREPAEVRCLVAGEPCQHKWLDGRLTMHIDRLGLLEAVRIEE